MSLLFFVDGGFNNGVGTLLVEQLKVIHKQYKKVSAVTSSKEQEAGLINSIKEANIPYLHLEGLEHHQNYKRHIKQLTDYIINNNITKIHVQTNWQLILITIIKYRLLFNYRFKIIYTIHSYRNNLHPIKAFSARIMIGLALLLFSDRVICSCNFLKKKFAFLKYKTVLLPIGIADSFWDDYKDIETDRLKLVFPAQFRIGKNQDLIIQAFSNYIKHTNDNVSSLCLPGEGPLMNKMKSLVSDLGISKQVDFPGQCSIDEVKNLYLESNIGIISSNSETFGLCIVEPYVLGRCIITRHVGVADDIIINGINGFYFNNQTDLEKIFADLAKNKGIIKSMGKYNFDRRDRFKWNTITSQYIQMLNKL